MLIKYDQLKHLHKYIDSGQLMTTFVIGMRKYKDISKYYQYKQNI